MAYCTLQNETKRNATERNEMERNEMKIKRNFSRPATCQVSITGEHFFCVNGSRAKLKTFV